MHKRLLVSLIVALVSGAPLRWASAALVAVDDNVLSDGVLEYLTMDEVGAVTSAGLQLKLAGPIAGRVDWRLGTRQELYDMVRRNLSMPLADYVFNDGFVGGALIGTDPNVDAVLDDPGLELVRSGDARLALELRNMILLFEESGAGPAFLLTSLGTAETNGTGGRYVMGIGAYYNSSDGTSIARNNTIRGPGSILARQLSAEVINQPWFVVRAVPEPAAGALLLVGGIFAAAGGRRYRRR